MSKRTKIILSRPENWAHLKQLKHALIDVYIGPGVLDNVNRDLAALAAQVLATWAFVELNVAMVCNAFLQGSMAATTEILQNIQNRFSRRDAIIGAARAAGLSGEDVELIRRTLKEINCAGERRSVYAHYVWIYSP